MSVHELLGTALPIIQAPMAGVQDGALAAAVCAAGGLGSLPCALLDRERLREQLGSLRALAQPYNVNFFCHEEPAPDPAREAAWRELLAPYYAEFGIDTPAAAAAGSGRRPFDADAAALLEEFRPPIVSFHFGLPSPGLLQRVRDCGARILGSATTVDEARWLESRGVDAVIAQGLEAGGHRGNFLSNDPGSFGTSSLLQRIVGTVRVPVIAAGGIADARGVAAALALGACAVQVGTAYLLCHESTTSAVHRAALASEGARTTALTNLFSGRLARGIVNRLMRELGPVRREAPAFPLAATAIAPLRAAAERLGRGDFSPLWAGQDTSGCRRVGATRLTRELAGAIGAD